MKKCLLSMTLMAAILSAGCAIAGWGAAEPHEIVSGEAPHAAHWTYSGDSGPDHWADLDPSFESCRAGKSQSPIDIANLSPDAMQDLPNIAFHYQPSALRILNNGHTVQVNYDPGSFIELDGGRYEVVQFHFHEPSEHAVNGAPFAAEMHIVHKNAANELAVVGILLEVGEENPAYQPLLNHWPEALSDEHDMGITISAADFLPAQRATWRYSGSLTTPPCSEGVNWFVMTTPVQISNEQIAHFDKVFRANNRPVQPLNGRRLIEDVTP